MQETVEMAELLHTTPTLFPWVCLSIILIVAATQQKRILAYFDARIDAYKERQQSDAVLAELIRNNTAALNNNTAALESVKQDRGESRRLIQYHESMSKERMEHIQAVANRIEKTVLQNEKNITVLKDRRSQKEE